MSNASAPSPLASIASAEPATPAAASSPVLLDVRALVVGYGGIRAVKGVDLRVHEGELISLIGANGAGKTSILNAIAASLKPQAGAIFYRGQDTRALGAWDLVRQGLATVPEGRGVFTRLSVHENLLIGAYSRGAAPDVEEDLERQYAQFPRLRERRRQLAGTLSGGEQQMLAMARALMSRPRMLLLDEPSMGLAPLLVDKIFEVIQGLHAQGMTVLLVEQNASRALALADRAYVLESGLVSLQGAASELLQDARVRSAYLGH